MTSQTDGIDADEFLTWFLWQMESFGILNKLETVFKQDFCLTSVVLNFSIVSNN